MKITPQINPQKNLKQALKDSFKNVLWRFTGDYKNSLLNLNNYCNKFFGEKAVILCNGPSLNNVIFEDLQGVKTFGLNKINLLFDRTLFRPSFIVAVNKYVIEQNEDFYRSTKIPLFLSQKPSRKVGIDANSNRTLLYTSEGFPGFSGDPRSAISEGATVTYAALQLAYFMGFSKIALVGCDHSFSSKGPDHKAVVSGENDVDHFDKRYFSKGVKWQLPSIAESEESYLKAKRFFEKDSRIIYNCTVGGKLEIYPRLSLDEFLIL